MICESCEPGLNMCIHMCQANTLNVEPVIIVQANVSKLTDTGLTVLVVTNNWQTKLYMVQLLR